MFNYQTTVSLKEKNNGEIQRKYIEYEEYYVLKDNKAYKIIVGKINNEIIIKYKKYEMKINNVRIPLFRESGVNSIDEGYEYLINIFEQNNVIIKDIVINKTFKLILKMSIDYIEEEKEIILLYSKDNSNSIKSKLNFKTNNNENEIVDLKDEIEFLRTDLINLKDEVNLLRNEFNNLNVINNPNNTDYLFSQISNKSMPRISPKKNLSPKNMKFLKDLTSDSYSSYSLDNSFSVFKSINDILYLIYSNKNRAIISFNLVTKQKMSEIANAHDYYITNLRHYLDEINRRDLVMSISKYNNNIKIWNANDFQCLFNVKDINKQGELLSACLLMNNDEINVISSNDSWEAESEPIKVYDIEGHKIKEINEFFEPTYFIDSYYDKQLCKNYLITGHRGFVISYDYDKNKIYHKYYDKDNRPHCSIIIYNKDDIIKLIDSCDDGNIRIWNFHTGTHLNRIRVNNEYIFGICLWDEDYLFVGCKDKIIKLIDLNNGIIIKDLYGHKNNVIAVKKINHPKYGDCLISQGVGCDEIKLWINKK